MKNPAAVADANRLPDAGAGCVWDDSHGPLVIRPPAGRAVFTTRRGGVSQAPFDTLNLALSVGDDEEAVRANRDIAGRTIGGAVWSRMRQVHGVRTVQAAPPDEHAGEADAVWTDDPSRTIAVFAADCVPILLLGDGRVGAAHAGWRGLVGGVVENAAEPVRPHTVLAGPAIGPCCFEVGPEVIEIFARRCPEAVADERHIDLWVAVEAAAAETGARDVRSIRLCTSCHPHLFFSHRRQRGRTGRQALVAALEDR